MLSKPNAESSAGSSDRTSTSTASRSRMTLPYSARFRRCSSGRPGLGTAPARSSSAVSHDVSDAMVASSGRGIPCGGMARVRTLRATVSQMAGCVSTWARSSVSSASPAVRVRWLWQVTQYRSRTARGGASVRRALRPPARRRGGLQLERCRGQAATYTRQAQGHSGQHREASRPTVGHVAWRFHRHQRHWIQRSASILSVTWLRRHGEVFEPYVPIGFPPTCTTCRERPSATIATTTSGPA